ncbi:MAG: nitrous oxide reductase family maturation protein NosD, partial [Candidatus Thorarchaeota archaeon]
MLEGRRLASKVGMVPVIVFTLLFLFPVVSGTQAESFDAAVAESGSILRNPAVAATPHAPIRILSNNDFKTQGWAGEGTEEDPYVIEGLLIKSKEVGIYVYKADVYFVIRNCVVTSDDDAYGAAGVFFEKVLHGSVEGCNISRETYGIRTLRSLECTVSDNTVTQSKKGIFFDKAYNSSATRNTVSSCQYGIYSLKSNIVTAKENDISEASIGILAEETYESYLIENTIYDSDWGVYLYSCGNTEIESNIISGGQVGLDIEYSSRCTVLQNDIHHNGYGIYSYSSTDCSITMNHIHANSIAGAYIGASHMLQITWNTIERNPGVGVHLKDSTSCLVFANEIGWNSKGNAKDSFRSATVSPNMWDNGVDMGNGWSDYVFGSTYAIAGDVGSEDTYPSAILAVVGPGTFEQAVGEIGLVTWKASAIWPDYYEIRLEGVLIDSGDWDGRNVMVELTGLGIGTHLCSLFLNTTSGRSTTDVVRVVVGDRTSPVWTKQPIDQTIELGDHVDFTVEASDVFGIESYWLNDTASFSIDSAGRIMDKHALALGAYGLELRAYDPSDNFCTALIRVVVRDTVKPTVIEPEDITFIEGETVSDIVWEAKDLSDVAFEVYRDETLFASGHLSGGSNSIRVTVEDLTSGLYSFLLVLTDEGGNVVEDQVNVEVLEPKTKTTITTTPTVTTVTKTTTETSTTTSDTSTGPTTQSPWNASLYVFSLGVGIALALAIVTMILQRRGVS